MAQALIVAFDCDRNAQPTIAGRVGVATVACKLTDAISRLEAIRARHPTIGRPHADHFDDNGEALLISEKTLRIADGSSHALSKPQLAQTLLRDVEGRRASVVAGLWQTFKGKRSIFDVWQ